MTAIAVRRSDPALELALKGALDRLRARIDWQEYGAAPLLGAAPTAPVGPVAPVSPRPQVDCRRARTVSASRSA